MRVSQPPVPALRGADGPPTGDPSIGASSVAAVVPGCGFTLAIDERDRLCASIGDGEAMHDVAVVPRPLTERSWQAVWLVVDTGAGEARIGWAATSSRLGETPSPHVARAPLPLFQINVEEGRHLWAMVYLLHAHFGRDGREEAEALLERRSGDADRPRILGAFNEQTPDWLALFMFTFLTDRDGKFQLHSLAESAFDPLARTCRFMLTEEAHHMFVGITGLARVVQRTCGIMREHRTDEVRKLGVIDLPTFQKYLNFHFSVTLDLFGAEVSTNAAASYTAGLKGRFHETGIDDDHRLDGASYPVLRWRDGAFRKVEAPALNALNERLRDDFLADVAAGVERINRVIRSFGVDFRVTLPHVAFNRRIGAFAELDVTPQGDVIDAGAWRRREGEWLPTEADRAYVRSLMPGAVTEPGRFANWIAPPSRGIDHRPVDFEYVRLD